MSLTPLYFCEGVPVSDTGRCTDPSDSTPQNATIRVREADAHAAILTSTNSIAFQRIPGEKE
jgi:hypothetical protein